MGVLIDVGALIVAVTLGAGTTDGSLVLVVTSGIGTGAGSSSSVTLGAGARFESDSLFTIGCGFVCSIDAEPAAGVTVVTPVDALVEVFTGSTAAVVAVTFSTALAGDSSCVCVKIVPMPIIATAPAKASMGIVFATFRGDAALSVSAISNHSGF